MGKSSAQKPSTVARQSSFASKACRGALSLMPWKMEKPARIAPMTRPGPKPEAKSCSTSICAPWLTIG